MLKVYFKSIEKFPDAILAFCYMVYVTLVIASIVLFNQMIEFRLLNMTIDISGSIIPYVFLYPISFIVLRIYGYKTVNQMILCMILASLVFTSMCFIITILPTNSTDLNPNGLRYILHSSFKMYLGGFIALPAGIYASFLTLSFLDYIGLNFGAISLTIATIIGEIVNTIIVFPIGFHGVYNLSIIFNNIIIDALIFKAIAGTILAIFTIFTIKLIVNHHTK